ncbi:HAD family hydrolase [Pedosphaera parvula]|uniref:Haloacid dehalogenase domain protein hydrolase type 3 n=1 Tax=Pedosphaera parvula (strain Ellin514) TaxID=320771 RepID=B9XK18_PEDPL|nr:HAD family hydrolase [Pedosphaera parvula]EEF59841.1 Haloacid dehalogenase domain protein hydrolase type 3 [Pedosphaera parvula Ellin514]
MNLPIKIISTDFDGTLFAEFENPPIPKHLLKMIADLQARGAKWVINTGRDMSSLMEALARSHVEEKPDYLVLVEREIHCHKEMQYVGLDDWNSTCHREHAELFVRVRQDLPRLVSWVESQYKATIYEDPYSPFCLIAQNNGDADAIHAYMEDYCKEVPNLQVVRNDVYARFAHTSYNKGTALAELGRRLGIAAEHIFAAGDHLNDIPMLHQRYARYLTAPANAIPVVKELVRSQNGFVSELFQGHGIAEGLKFHLEKSGVNHYQF